MIKIYNELIRLVVCLSSKELEVIMLSFRIHIPLIILALMVLASTVLPQGRETAIIPKEDIMTLFSILNDMEMSIAQHSWAKVLNTFLDSTYSASLKEGDKWKDFEWVADLFYPEDKGTTPKENTDRANSITSFKHFISEVSVFKEPGCDFLIVLKVVRTIEFDLGKRFIAGELNFCKSHNAWLLKKPAQ
jgi:hypothetical protein